VELSTVPEPATNVLLAFSFAALLLVRGKKTIRA
jgi:hypothetical protein